MIKLDATIVGQAAEMSRYPAENVPDMTAAWISSQAEVDIKDLWCTLAAMTGGGLGSLALILPEAPHHQGAGMYRADEWTALWADRSSSDAIEALKQVHAEGTARATLAAVDASGSIAFWDIALSRLIGRDAILAVASDVTDRMSREQQLRRIAYQDGLTGLLNRAALRERLEEEISKATSDGGSVALLMLDLDNFKLINDTLGHDAGDAVLVEAATRLRATVSPENAVGRLGGDEFAVLLTSVQPGARTAFLAEDLVDALRRPVMYKGRALDTRASIGIASFPAHGSDASELLKNADIALYAAKSFGRGGFTTYVPSMGNTLRKRVSTIALVRDAIAQHRLEAFYQPKIDLQSNRIIGHEALLRLRDDEGTLIPAHAISFALEDIDLARRIGDIMFERVANDVRHWKDAGIPVGRVALNASAAEFRAGDFASRLLEKIRRAELSPDLFEIEVAETVLVGRGTDYVATALADLADAGVCVALDEFGTGASSLAQLKRLPFHSIKIDRTFVGTLENDNEDQAIVRAIAGIADGLGLGMTAVEVETAGQVAELCKLGCGMGQGNLLGPPAPAHAVGKMRELLTPQV